MVIFDKQNSSIFNTLSFAK